MIRKQLTTALIGERLKAEAEVNVAVQVESMGEVYEVRLCSICSSLCVCDGLYGGLCFVFVLCVALPCQVC